MTDLIIFVLKRKYFPIIINENVKEHIYSKLYIINIPNFFFDPLAYILVLSNDKVKRLKTVSQTLSTELFRIS